MTGDVVLRAEQLSAGYHGVPAVQDVTLSVSAGELVLLAGANGAGKTTTVAALAGVVAPLHGEAVFEGCGPRAPLHQRAVGGLGYVPERRPLFMGLTVWDNLRLGLGEPDAVLAIFPQLESRVKIRAGLLSGGEQQMLVLGRVLASKPKVILVDEMSLGLAPMVVERLLSALRQACDEDGVGVLLVEQHVDQALRVADSAFFLRRGQVVGEGPAAAFHDRALVASYYL